MVVESCSRHHRDCGDKSKSFYMITFAALSACSDVLDDVSPCCFSDTARRRMLIRRLTWFLQNILLNEKLHSHLLESCGVVVKCSGIRSASRQVIKTFLTGKFSVDAVDFLADRILSLIGDNSFSSHYCLSSTLAKLEKHFDCIVYEISGVLLRESRTVKGIVIKHPLPSQLSRHAVHKLIVVTFDDDLLPLSDVSMEFSSSVISTTKVLMEWIEKCSKQFVSVICFKGKALETFRSLCEESEISLIDCLLSDDVELICASVNRLPICDITEKLGAYIADVKLSEVEIGNQIFTNIIPVHTSATASLLLCSPSPGLCSLYKTSVFNSLRVLQHWLHGCDQLQDTFFKSTLVRGKGSFFMLLHNFLSDMDRMKQILNNVAWSSQVSSDYRLIFSIISKALLVVPQTLYQNSFNKKDKNFRFFHYIKDLNELASSSMLDRAWTSDPVEPMSCQLALLHKVLITVVQILRIDSMISCNAAN